MGYIDLHTHSTASDGTLSPRALVRHAAEVGLCAIALTDHDSVLGVREAVEAGREFGVRVIPGVELSAEYPGELHILGLFLDAENPALTKALARIVEHRGARNIKMLEKLGEIGIKISFDEVSDISAGGAVGRVHIARALVNRGHAKGIDEAFKKYLVRGAPGYARREKPSPEDAIKIIKSAGGIAVLAHPVFLELNAPGLRKLLTKLMGYGLGGLECIYPEHDERATREYISIARELGLYITGGSDFHGENKPRIKLGMAGRGRISAALLDEINL